MLAGGVNDFRYASNNPVGRADPWSLVYINLLNPQKDPWLHSQVKLLPTSPKKITLAGHADSREIDDERGKQSKPLNAKTLAPEITSHPKYSQDTTIVLYACDAGKGNISLAEQLSKRLGNTVVAADESVLPENGRTVVAPISPTDQNAPDMSKKRRFRVFRP